MGVYEDQNLYSDGFRAGYVQAIGDADFALRKRGDDRQTRQCRRDVLVLANVAYDPEHAMPQPDWSKHKGRDPEPYTPPACNAEPEQMEPEENWAGIKRGTAEGY